MRGLVQRVRSASVTVGGEVVGAIDAGLCVLVGVTHADTVDHARKLADKIWNLRVIDDEADRKSTRLNSSHSQQSRMPSSA